MHLVIIPGNERLRQIKIRCRWSQSRLGVSSLNKTTTSGSFFLSLFRRIFDLGRHFSLFTGLRA
uniref:Uncharacterized protein n=1 Tax=Lepeophtheirus salmonis TaxID=72036 RepID=A0A0K2UI17_LEPSM